MQDRDQDRGSNSATDEGVWFSFLCATVAFAAAYKHPSIGMNMIFLLMLSWFLWSLYKMTADRMS